METTNKETKTLQKDEVIEGYNPRVYRTLSALFIVLTILNLSIVIYSFYKIGYGLWHAENALSYIANINSSFGDISNENGLFNHEYNLFG